MTIDKIDGVWAAEGTTTPEPTDEKKAVGWVSGMAADQPHVETFNYLQNRVEAAIDRIIEERVNTFYDGATDPKKMISTRLWTDSWGSTVDDANIIGTDSSSDCYVDMAVFFIGSDPYLMVLNIHDCCIQVWNCRTLEHEEELDSGDLSDDLPTAGDPNWYPISMCTDGTYVYVTFYDTYSSTPEVYYIQAWRISNWTVKTGWPTTGTHLPGTGEGEGPVRCKVIIANSTKLATVNSLTISADTTAVISIIDIADGSIDASGAGDANTGESAVPFTTSICSDGSNIYFATLATDHLRICSASIADPTAGCGGTGYPLDRGHLHYYPVLLSCGPNLVVSITRPESSDDTLVVMRTHNSTSADLEQFVLGQDCSATPIIGDDNCLGRIYDALFDGLNLWLLSMTTPSLKMDSLIKIDVGKLSTLNHDASYRQITDIIGGQYNIHSDIEADDSEVCSKHIAFDGRDIWVIPDSLSSQTMSGRIYRLPLAFLRS